MLSSLFVWFFPSLFLFFFFQAEDGIRDYKVTGVQTCALPIFAGTPMPSYADSLEPDQVWDLAFYVLSLSRGGRAAEAGGRGGGGPGRKEGGDGAKGFVANGGVRCVRPRGARPAAADSGPTAGA